MLSPDKWYGGYGRLVPWLSTTTVALAKPVPLESIRFLPSLSLSDIWRSCWRGEMHVLSDWSNSGKRRRLPLIPAEALSWQTDPFVDSKSRQISLSLAPRGPESAGTSISGVSNRWTCSAFSIVDLREHLEPGVVELLRLKVGASRTNRKCPPRWRWELEI